MRKIFRCTLTAAAAAGLLAAALPATADATSPRGVSAVTIFDHVVGNMDYVLKEITIAPEGSTGWHYHPGSVFGVVKQGVLTHNKSDCSVDGVYRAGQFISEQTGPGYVHLGRNLGTTPLVLYVLYEDPVGSPLAVSVPNPGCSFM